MTTTILPNMPRHLTWAEIKHWGKYSHSIYEPLVITPQKTQEWFTSFFTSTNAEFLKDTIVKLGIAYVIFARDIDSYFAKEIDRVYLVPDQHMDDPLYNYSLWFKVKHQHCVFTGSEDFTSYNPHRRLPKGETISILEFWNAVLIFGSYLSEHGHFNWTESRFSDPKFERSYFGNVALWVKNYTTLMALFQAITYEVSQEYNLPVAPTIEWLNSPQRDPETEVLADFIWDLVSKRSGMLGVFATCLRNIGSHPTNKALGNESFLKFVLQPQILSAFQDSLPPPLWLLHNIHTTG